MQPQFAAHDDASGSMGIFSLTAGCIFLMWLGEQIDEYGLGNGISLIILAGIVARMPQAIVLLVQQTNFSATPDADQPIGIGQDPLPDLLVRLRRRRLDPDHAGAAPHPDPAGQAHARPAGLRRAAAVPAAPRESRRRDADHLRPVADALPGRALRLAQRAGQRRRLGQAWFGSIVQFLNDEFGRGAFVYILTEIAMIYFFAYFWTTVQFQPKEMANQLRDYGSFIPGLRPGKRTADYLEKVMMRITYVGAAFLCIIAVIPTAHQRVGCRSRSRSPRSSAAPGC